MHPDAHTICRDSQPLESWCHAQHSLHTGTSTLCCKYSLHTGFCIQQRTNLILNALHSLLAPVSSESLNGMSLVQLSFQCDPLSGTRQPLAQELRKHDGYIEYGGCPKPSFPAPAGSTEAEAARSMLHAMVLRVASPARDWDSPISSTSHPPPPPPAAAAAAAVAAPHSGWKANRYARRFKSGPRDRSRSSAACTAGSDMSGGLPRRLKPKQRWEGFCWSGNR